MPCWGGKESTGYHVGKFGRSAGPLGRVEWRVGGIPNGEVGRSKKLKELIILSFGVNIVHISDSTSSTAVANRGVFSLLVGKSPQFIAHSDSNHGPSQHEAGTKPLSQL